MLFYLVFITPWVRWAISQTMLGSPYSILLQLLISFYLILICQKRDGDITGIILNNYFFQHLMLEFILTELYLRKHPRFAFILTLVFILSYFLSTNSTNVVTRNIFFFMVNLCFLYRKFRTTLLASLFSSRNEDFFLFFNSDFYRKFGREVSVGWLYVLYLIRKRSAEKKVFRTIGGKRCTPLIILNQLPPESYQKWQMSYFSRLELSKKEQIRSWFFFGFEIILALFCAQTFVSVYKTRLPVRTTIPASG